MFGNLGQLQSGHIITAGSLGGASPTSIPPIAQLSSLQAPSLQSSALMQFSEQSTAPINMTQFGSMNVPLERPTALPQFGSMNAPPYGSMNVPTGLGFGPPLAQQIQFDGPESPPTGLAFPAQPQPMESFQLGIETPAVFNFGNPTFTDAPSGFTFGASGPATNIGQVNPESMNRITETKRSPRFGEPGYKSPFDTTSPFEPSYKSPFDTPVCSEPAYENAGFKESGFSYASPQVGASIHNGPWIAPDLDRAILEAYEVLAEKSLGECWKRIKGREKSPQPDRHRTNGDGDEIATRLTLRPEVAQANESIEVYQNDRDPWLRPSRLSKHETEAFWSQKPEAKQVRASLFAPKKHEHCDESDWMFIGRMMQSTVGSWIEETKDVITGKNVDAKAEKPSMLANGLPRTKLDLDHRETRGAPRQMPTMPLRSQNERTRSAPVRHWWNVRTKHEEAKACKFSNKAMVVSQPDDCSDIRAEALMRSFGISAACKKGTKDAPNHDGFSISRFDDSYLWGPLTLYCVFDGHGTHGAVITQLCCDLLPKLLFEQLQRLTSSIPPEGLGYVRTPEELEHVRCAVQEVFIIMQQFLEQLTVKGNICSRESGATATLLLQGVERDASGNEDPWLLVGHVGDTRAVLWRPAPDDIRVGRDSKPESPEVLELTRDHRPDNPRERQRIEQAGARVEAFSVEKGTVRPLDPRVLSDGQTWPALNMSRCLGDLFSHTQGVSELPEIRIKDIQFGDKIIICTDGVWDVISPAEAQVIVQDADTRSSGPNNAAETVTHEAQKRWIERTGDFYDDITCLVIDIS